MKKNWLCKYFLLHVVSLCFAAMVIAADQGPAEITLQATIDSASTPKPALFPHGVHQSKLECATCHHGKGADGKRIPYVDGQKIEKCETCHNSKAGMSEKVNTFKNAAHALCQDCHKKNNPELAKCGVCHKKESTK